MSEEEKKNEVAFIEATFESPMQWHLEDYKEELKELGITCLTYDDIADVFIKYGECTIHLKNGERISLGQGSFGEPDYKWPTNFELYNEEWYELSVSTKEEEE